MNNTTPKQQKLINAAKELRVYRDAYIIARMWASRGPDTSIKDIEDAVLAMRELRPQPQSN